MLVMPLPIGYGWQRTHVTRYAYGMGLLNKRHKTGTEYDSPIKDMRAYGNWSLDFKLWGWGLWMKLKVRMGDKLSSIHYGEMSPYIIDKNKHGKKCIMLSTGLCSAGIMRLSPMLWG
jgi:hypothetical protein